MKSNRIFHAAHRCALTAALLAGTPAFAVMPSLDTLVHFTGNLPAAEGNGAYMTSHLTEGEDGKLYVTGLYGGAIGNLDRITPWSQSRYGGIGPTFSVLDVADGSYTVLSRYPGATVSSTVLPGPITRGSDGHLYATLGGLQRWNADTRQWDLLRAISSSADGVLTAMSWTEGLDGRLYGTGRRQSYIYSLEKDGSDLRVLRTNSGNAEGTYLGNLVAHSNGRIYGLASNGGSLGGSFSGGVIFSVNPADGSDYVQLHDFPSDAALGINDTSGSLVRGQLVEGPDGRLYGVSPRGGEHGQGRLFRIDADGQHFTMLHDFKPVLANTDGREPHTLMVGSDGHLYGVTKSGGITDSGVIFRWNRDTETYQTLYTFDALTGPAVNPAIHTSTGLNQGENYGSNTDGRYPFSLTLGRDGQIYGITALGGSSGWGTLFRFAPGDEVPVFTFTPKLEFVVGPVTAYNNSDASHITIGQGFGVRLRWRGQNVKDCEASTDEPGANPSWAGARPTSFGTLGSLEFTGEVYTPASLGTWTYTLTCQSNEPAEPDPVSRSVTVEVLQTVPDVKKVGDSGGALSPVMLLPLLGLGGLLRRRRRA